MKKTNVKLCVLLGCSVKLVTFGQGVINGRFEAANLSPIPSGQFGGLVAISNALPGWNGFVGGSPVTQVLQNGYYTGSPGISILGPVWTDPGTPIIDGNYSALLQAGTDNALPVSASLAQMDSIPVTARSIDMKVAAVIGDSSLSLLGVTLGGQPITMVPLSTGPNYTLMGGDISAFAGQTENLTISALYASGFEFNSLEIDDITYSSQVVPEPGTLALLSGGGVLLCCCRWKRGGRMKSCRSNLVLIIGLLFLPSGVFGQGVINGGFEAANVPVIPAGQSGGFVDIGNAMPGWSGCLGGVPVTQVLQNNYNSGTAGISILVPNWSDPGFPIIQGSYTALLQAGFNGQADVSTSLEQSSLVPVTAESIQMKVQPVFGGTLSFLGVTVAGQNIQMVPLSVQPTYTLMGGDISAFEGQTELLTISSLTSSSFEFNNLEVDSIVYSNQSVPEPGALALLTCGTAIICYCRSWRKR